MSRLRILTGQPLLIQNVKDTTKGASEGRSVESEHDARRTVAAVDSTKSYRWNLIHLPAQGDGDPFILIQLENERQWAYVDSDPAVKEGDAVLLNNSTATIWRIGYSDDKDKVGHYIYPATHNNLLWGIADGATEVGFSPLPSVVPAQPQCF
ncbi:hypothetical protein BDW22DRAFT_1432852 [Trametopsis cervina]|nr:hypothetical protein BDW22DRAFT_1432852 [Trametopsis cervina]